VPVLPLVEQPRSSAPSTVPAQSAADLLPPPPPPPALVMQPLPNCSVLFFHHLEKTAGTTLRSVLQRHAQLGLFDFFSFVNRFNKVQFQTVTHRLDEAIRTPGGLEGLRLAVEIHIGGGGYEQFLKYTLPDLLHLRHKLRSAGCRCNLVTLLRHPLLQHISWHHHFVNHRVPLCFWSNPHDCQSRMSMALACHGGPSIQPLTPNHRRAIQVMWDAFDLVGITEHFDEFLVLLADLAGLQLPAYRIQLGTKETTDAREATRRWSRRTCAELTAEPPPALLKYISKRMAESAKAAEGFKQRMDRGDSHGPKGMMDCAGYGPCDFGNAAGKSAAEVRRVQTAYTWLDRSQCEAVTPEAVLTRLCGRIASDEPLYLTARARFEAAERAHHAEPAVLAARVALLHEAGVALEARAKAQERERPDALAARAKTTLSRRYTRSSGGGVPWVVDEYAGWYKPHERARYSCAGCSGDVVPEKDLVGCWPLWPQFGPDEMAYTCTREWTLDPGQDSLWQKGASAREPLPCWQTCWTPLRNASEPKRCTAACPAREAALAAAQWRQTWDAELAAFKARPGGLGQLLEEATEFINPLPNRDFMWHVY